MKIVFACLVFAAAGNNLALGDDCWAKDVKYGDHENCECAGSSCSDGFYRRQYFSCILATGGRQGTTSHFFWPEFSQQAIIGQTWTCYGAPNYGKIIQCAIAVPACGVTCAGCVSPPTCIPCIACFIGIAGDCTACKLFTCTMNVESLTNMTSDQVCVQTGSSCSGFGGLTPPSQLPGSDKRLQSLPPMNNGPSPNDIHAPAPLLTDL